MTDTSVFVWIFLGVFLVLAVSDFAIMIAILIQDLRWLRRERERNRKP